MVDWRGAAATQLHKVWEEPAAAAQRAQRAQRGPGQPTAEEAREQQRQLSADEQTVVDWMRRVAGGGPGDANGGGDGEGARASEVASAGPRSRKLKQIPAGARGGCCAAADAAYIVSFHAAHLNAPAVWGLGEAARVARRSACLPLGWRSALPSALGTGRVLPKGGA